MLASLHQTPNAVFAQERFEKGKDAIISRSLSHHQKKECIFDPSDVRRLRLHEAIFKGFDGERVIGPAKIYLKPYWKERGVSYFHQEGEWGASSSLPLDSADSWLLTPEFCLSHLP